jgi:hypothetical protein
MLANAFLRNRLAFHLHAYVTVSCGAKRHWGSSLLRAAIARCTENRSPRGQ